MVDPTPADLVFVHLRLCPFPTINQEKLIIEGDHLGRRMAVKGGNSRIVSKNRNREHRLVLGMINRAGSPAFVCLLKNNTKSNRKRI